MQITINFSDEPLRREVHPCEKLEKKEQYLRFYEGSNAKSKKVNFG